MWQTAAFRDRGPAMSKRALVLSFVASLSLVPPTPAIAQDGRFDRTLTVTGPASLRADTGSGSITVRQGSGGRIEVRATITVNRGWSLTTTTRAADLVREVEANPPVKQDGNAVSLMQPASDEARRALSISYDVSVPPDTEVTANSGSGEVSIDADARAVTASTGSGDIRVRQVRGAATITSGSGSVNAEAIGGRGDLNTGSGDIVGHALRAGAKARSGSGDVDLTLSGAGDVSVSTGSGEITIHDANGAVNARSGSGTITVSGTPAADWSLDASSGDISVQLPAGAAYVLDARTSSGEIRTAGAIKVDSQSRRGLRGTVGEGGRLLSLHTSSGDITVR